MIYIHLNKQQTDNLGWTDKHDPNDIIIVNSIGDITQRRPMMGLFPQDDGTYVSKYVYYELDEVGNWNCKEITT